jgi:hypothetical protein
MRFQPRSLAGILRLLALTCLGPSLLMARVGGPLDDTAQKNLLPSQSSAAAGDQALVEAIRAHLKAQCQFDQAALQAMTDSTYLEISPIGELDPKTKMLGFYAPEKKIPVNEPEISEVQYQIHDSIAVVSARLTYRKGPAEPDAILASFRTGYVLRRSGGAWVLLYVQYTPIRPSKPQNPASTGHAQAKP